jgi:SOS-response transcriptional repressor LexA
VTAAAMPGSHVGFTGTRQGMNAAQIMNLRCELEHCRRLDFMTFHHGSCQGADDQAAHMAYSIGFWVVAHPPINQRYIAFPPVHEYREASEYLERDRAIVNDSDFVVAAPGTMHEVMRGSGTWYTVRQARSASKPGKILFPDGSVKDLDCSS